MSDISGSAIESGEKKVEEVMNEEQSNETLDETNGTGEDKNSVVRNPDDVFVGVIMESLTMNSGLYKKSVDYLKEHIHDIIDMTDVNPMVDLLPRLMEHVEKLASSGLDGPQKRKLVLRLMNWILDNAEELGLDTLHERADDMRTFINDVAPSMIDLIVAATRGKLNINMIAEASSRCLPLCCGIISRS